MHEQKQLGLDEHTERISKIEDALLRVQKNVALKLSKQESSQFKPGRQHRSKFNVNK